MGISDRIEAFIIELMKEEGQAELKRNELAGLFECVPSQINYVISTRFSPERGYAVESRRGGGGYMRIRRICNDNTISSAICAIGERLDYQKACAYIKNLLDMNKISDECAGIMEAAVSDTALNIDSQQKDKLRASIMKSMLIQAEKQRKG